jgi:hypothetical protein
MADFFILVLDKYVPQDLGSWVYSASAKTLADLGNVNCYDDPPHSLPRASFLGVNAGPMALAPCAGGDADPGVIYGMTHA